MTGLSGRESNKCHSKAANTGDLPRENFLVNLGAFLALRGTTVRGDTNHGGGAKGFFHFFHTKERRKEGTRSGYQLVE